MRPLKLKGIELALKIPQNLDLKMPRSECSISLVLRKLKNIDKTINVQVQALKLNDTIKPLHTKCQNDYRRTIAGNRRFEFLGAGSCQSLVLRRHLLLVHIPVLRQKRKPLNCDEWTLGRSD